jgi:ABC-type Na+ efflux pump permease subunit
MFFASVVPAASVASYASLAAIDARNAASFGYLLDGLGLWTTTWMFLFAVTAVCMLWLSVVVRQMSRQV